MKWSFKDRLTDLLSPLQTLPFSLTSPIYLAFCEKICCLHTKRNNWGMSMPCVCWTRCAGWMVPSLILETLRIQTLESQGTSLSALSQGCLMDLVSPDKMPSSERGQNMIKPQSTGTSWLNKYVQVSVSQAILKSSHYCRGLLICSLAFIGTTGKLD